MTEPLKISSEIQEKLLENQAEHILNTLKVLRRMDVALDTSPMGLGKSFTTIALQLVAKYDKVVIFTPEITLKSWGDAMNHFGLIGTEEEKKIEVYSYNAFKKHKKPYLETFKTEQEVDGKLREQGKRKLTVEEKKSNAMATVEWLDLVKYKKVLLVFDEVQNLKNLGSKQSSYATILSQALLKANSQKEKKEERNNLLCLSATPFDKIEHVDRMCRLLNILRSKELGMSVYKTYIMTGYNEVLEFCKKKGIELSPEDLSIQKDSKEHLFSIWKNNIITNIRVSMKSQEKSLKQSFTNFFYNIDDEAGMMAIKQGVREINSAMKAISDRHLKDDALESAGVQVPIAEHLANISKGMKRCEFGKQKTFHRIVSEQLKSDPNCKVVVMLNYRHDEDENGGMVKNDLVSMLKKDGYEVLVINGSTPKDQRFANLEKFQRPNLDYRILIGNPQIIGEGCDLDDQDGRFPRVMFVSPSYFLIKLKQATGRIFRSKTKSDAKVIFVFAKDLQKEIALLKRLAEKGVIVKENLEYKEDVKLFDNFESAYESD